MNYPITKKNNAIYIIPFPFYRSNKNPKLCGGADVDYPAAPSVIAPYPVFCGVAVPSVPAARYCKRSFWFSPLLSLPLSMQDTADWAFSSRRSALCILLSMPLSGLWSCRSSRLWDNLSLLWIGFAPLRSAASFPYTWNKCRLVLSASSGRESICDKSPFAFKVSSLLRKWWLLITV